MHIKKKNIQKFVMLYANEKKDVYNKRKINVGQVKTYDNICPFYLVLHLTMSLKTTPVLVPYNSVNNKFYKVM